MLSPARRPIGVLRIAGSEQPYRNADGAGVYDHRPQRAPPPPIPHSSHFIKSPTPHEEVEDDYVDDSIEDTFCPENRLLERDAHEAGVRKHHRKAQDRARSVVAARKEAGEEDNCDMRERGDCERPEKAVHHRRVERTLEGVDDEAWRDDEKKDVHHPLYRCLVDETNATTNRTYRHQGEEHADLSRNCEQILHFAYYTILL